MKVRVLPSRCRAARAGWRPGRRPQLQHIRGAHGQQHGQQQQPRQRRAARPAPAGGGAAVHCRNHSAGARWGLSPTVEQVLSPCPRARQRLLLSLARCLRACDRVSGDWRHASGPAGLSAGSAGVSHHGAARQAAAPPHRAPGEQGRGCLSRRTQQSRASRAARACDKREARLRLVRALRLFRRAGCWCPRPRPRRAWRGATLVTPAWWWRCFTCSSRVTPAPRSTPRVRNSGRAAAIM